MIEIDDRVVMLLFILFLGYMLFNRKLIESFQTYINCCGSTDGECPFTPPPEGNSIFEGSYNLKFGDFIYYTNKYLMELDVLLKATLISCLHLKWLNCQTLNIQHRQDLFSMGC